MFDLEHNSAGENLEAALTLGFIALLKVSSVLLNVTGCILSTASTASHWSSHSLVNYAEKLKTRSGAENSAMTTKAHPKAVVVVDEGSDRESEVSQEKIVRQDSLEPQADESTGNTDTTVASGTDTPLSTEGTRK